VVNTVQQRLPYLRERCYVRRLARVPGLQGVITIAWTIRPDGRVENAEVVHNGTGDEWLARCTRNVVSDIRFPVSPQGQPTPARYPFQFRTQ
jgi:TonB family protein